MQESTWDLEDEEEFEDTQAGKFLTFGIETEDYGIPIVQVMEIIGIQKITPLPEMPDYVQGVINLRGKVIPVLDVRMKFGLEPAAYHDRTCVIVVAIQDTEVGLIVDRVQEVANINDENIEAPPKIQQSSKSRYIKGMGKIEDNVVIILEVSRLLEEGELQHLESQA